MGLTWSTSVLTGTDVLVLALVGELTRGTSRDLEGQLARLLSRPDTTFVVDLRSVGACDRAGLAMLEACRRAGMVAGVTIRLAAPSPAAHAALTASGLIDTFAVFGSVPDAVRG